VYVDGWRRSDVMMSGRGGAAAIRVPSSEMAMTKARRGIGGAAGRLMVWRGVLCLRWGGGVVVVAIR
jgi:hypothetical protein